MLSPGQSEALSELRDVVAINDGRITFRVLREPPPDGGVLQVLLSIDCRGETGPSSSVALMDREEVVVSVPARYPFEHPDARVTHERFAGLPHVIWAHGICLYLTANDWEPGRRMHGFVEQLLTWFEAVAHGTIVGPDIPWHAPLTGLRTGEYLVVRPDLPAVLEDDADLWLALAVIEMRPGLPYELRYWLTDPAEVAQLYNRCDGRSRETRAQGPCFVAPVVALPKPVGFSYPEGCEELRRTLEQQGLSPARYAAFDDAAQAYNTDPRGPDIEVPDILLLGSPAPDHYGIPSRVAHLAAWSLSAGDDPDEMAWLEVFDQRPRITTRRDKSRPAQWLAGKRIVVLGCGALGAPTAEFCVRAGAAETHVVDDGDVQPGILVRQPYTTWDIGCNKATALTMRLGHISPDSEVRAWPQNALTMMIGDGSMPEVDLVIDATANRSVAAALERRRWTAERPQPPLLSMVVGHDCERGVATLALPGASGAGVDILRHLAITASGDPELDDVLDDFFPAHPRTALFQPEPGCSEPTYVGSAADLTAFAAQLLNDVLAVLVSSETAGDVDFPPRWASVARASAAESARASPQMLQWPNDVVGRDHELLYQVRISLEALAAIRREVVVMTDTCGPHVETGGLLLGQVDHASRVVWITEADGPPAGSQARVAGFALDPTEARAWAAERRRRTRGMVAFIGAWHTHPHHLALPSDQDNAAMTRMARDGVPVLLMIVGGGADRIQRWLHGERLPDIFLKLYFP